MKSARCGPICSSCSSRGNARSSPPSSPIMPIASSQGSSIRRGGDLPPKSAPPWEARRAASGVRPSPTLPNVRNGAGRPGNRASRDVSACPALSGEAPPYPLGFSGKPICDGGAGRSVEDSALWFGKSHIPTKSVPAKPAHHGDAGWEDRFSDPGRPKAASRRGEAPRGGAFLLLWTVGETTTPESYPQPRLVLKYGFSDVLRKFAMLGKAWKS